MIKVNRLLLVIAFIGNCSFYTLEVMGMEKDITINKPIALIIELLKKPIPGIKDNQNKDMMLLDNNNKKGLFIHGFLGHIAIYAVPPIYKVQGIDIDEEGRIVITDKLTKPYVNIQKIAFKEGTSNIKNLLNDAINSQVQKSTMNLTSELIQEIFSNVYNKVMEVRNDVLSSNNKEDKTLKGENSTALEKKIYDMVKSMQKNEILEYDSTFMTELNDEALKSDIVFPEEGYPRLSLDFLRWMLYKIKKKEIKPFYTVERTNKETTTPAKVKKSSSNNSNKNTNTLKHDYYFLPFADTEYFYALVHQHESNNQNGTESVYIEKKTHKLNSITNSKDKKSSSAINQNKRTRRGAP